MQLVYCIHFCVHFFFFFQAEDGIRDVAVTGVQTCALPIFHISACVHARNTPASSAGQISGSSTPHGHRAESAVTSHRIATAAVPYSIGQPTRAAVLSGSANMRAG